MEKTVYVRLLGEGVPVYRPVEASEIRPGIVILKGSEIHDPEDEDWEFDPGSCVVVEERLLDGEPALVAIAKEGLGFKS